MELNFNLSEYARGKTQLSPSFQPGPHDVICARGKRAHSHEGNERFRDLAKLHQEAYSNAPTKYQKSRIVSRITDIVREASGEGGFVKLIDGAWYEVGDRAAKEKIGQTLRDLLHKKYSSSTKAKARARVQKQMKAEASPEQMPSLQADDVKSSVSVVSHDYSGDHSVPASVPSHIAITKGEPSGESLLEALGDFDEFEFNNSDPFPVECAVPIEFRDTDLGVSLEENDLLYFCNAMGVAC